MKLLKRFGYYFIGLAMGSIAVLYFWKQKDVSFDYGFDARTLKQIRIRKLIFSEEAKKTMLKHNIDTSKINKILKTGDVDFGRSKPRKKPCAEYLIMGDSLEFNVVRCDSTSTINKIYVTKKQE